MALNKPISIGKIARTLGVASSDLGALCANEHGRINKWALRKPVRCPVLGVPTRQQYINTADGTRCGMEVVTTTNILDVHRCTYAYLPPRGGATEPYRIADFVGYNPNARPDAEIGVSTAMFDSQLSPYSALLCYLQPYSDEVIDELSGTPTSPFYEAVSLGNLLGYSNASAWSLMQGRYLVCLVTDVATGYSYAKVCGDTRHLDGQDYPMPTTIVSNGAAVGAFAAPMGANAPTQLKSYGRKTVSFFACAISSAQNSGLMAAANGWQRVYATTMLTGALPIPGCCGLSMLFAQDNRITLSHSNPLLSDNSILSIQVRATPLVTAMVAEAETETKILAGTRVELEWDVRTAATPEGASHVVGEGATSFVAEAGMSPITLWSKPGSVTINRPTYLLAHAWCPTLGKHYHAVWHFTSGTAQPDSHVGPYSQIDGDYIARVY